VIQRGTRALKLLHTADVHLDSDSYGKPEQRQAHRALFYRCFETIMTQAITEAVDLLLIAGDLFDHNRVPDETIAFTQEQLRRLQCPAVILPGNHDCLYTNAVYDRYNFSQACPNVQVITALNGQVIEFPDLELVVWGRAMEEHEPGFHPLAHIPTRQGKRWHVAMAHGFFYNKAHEVERSSPILAEEIRDTGWDYVAMGHQHVLTDVTQGDVVAYYSGAPLVNWTGTTPHGHVLLVELAPERGVIVQPQRLV
jgi:DNA repair exonuclease SbcCD nuclease subunit